MAYAREDRSLLIVSVALLLLGSGLFMFALLYDQSDHGESVVAQRDNAADPLRDFEVSLPVQDAFEYLVPHAVPYDFELLAKLNIRESAPEPLPLAPWETTVVLIADLEGCHAFIGSRPPVPLADPLPDSNGRSLWSAAITIGDYEAHDVRVLDAGGRLLRGPSVIRVEQGAPAPRYRFVSQ